MKVRIKKDWEISENQVTDESTYWNRREIIKGMGLGVASSLVSFPFSALAFLSKEDEKAAGLIPPPPKASSFSKLFPSTKNQAYKVEDEKRSITQEKYVTGYNNFYEFSLSKNDVAENAKKWRVADPWSLEVSGLCNKPTTFHIEDLAKKVGGLEQRIYRFRCVEAWSMVIPWDGFELAKLLKLVEPKSEAKFLKLTTLKDEKVMPGIKSASRYPWPYTEGLRLDEAMNPLTLLSMGVFGKELPKQNGAPIRLVVPWKYGFKSIKSIVKIELVSTMPTSLWMASAPKEYGFYANVNPQVNHPRWSQAKERVVDGSLFPSKIKTLMFNGYGSEVASLYKGMDLKKFY